MNQNIFILSVRYLLIDLVGGVLFFPIWWYSIGLILTWRAVVGSIRDYAAALGLEVWLKNIFVPMYGSYDWTGRLISFFMRLVQIIGRSLALFIYALLLCLLCLVYLILPVLVVYQIIFHWALGTTCC